MKLSQFFNLLSNKEDSNYFIYNYEQKENIEFTKKEIYFILNEFDFEIENINLYGSYDDICREYDGMVNVTLFLKNNDDLKEILKLKQKRKDKIEEINRMLHELKMKKDLL